MDRPRLVRATADAAVITLVLSGFLSPPDPFTQLLYAGPTFAVAVPAVYLYGEESFGSWWKRSLVFAGGVLAVALAWSVLAFAIPFDADVESAGRVGFLLVGVVFGAWLAYFGGLETLR